MVITGTFSKSPLAWGLPPDTTVISAAGARVQLNNGKTYLDWVSGLGSNLLGYCPPGFSDHVSRQLALTGGSLSLPVSLEGVVAEKLCDLLGNNVPGWNPAAIAARFAKTGSDVTTMAVRLARAATGRPWVLTFKGNYHGWHDWTIGRTEPGAGVLPVMEDSTAYDRRSWNRVIEVEPNPDLGGWFDFGTIAAIIFEQGITEPAPGWYDYLRDLCDQTGTLLIVDEVVTGLRYGPGGASECYSIKPDLMCLGKALGNGLPVSALVGRRDLMAQFATDNPVFCSSTMWGEAVGLAAAEYVLDNWDSINIAHLYGIGDLLIHGLNSAGWKCIGHAPRSLLTFESEVERAFFIHAMFEAGILMNRPNFPTAAHTIDDVDYTIDAAKAARAKWKELEFEQATEMMRDKMPRVLFRGR